MGLAQGLAVETRGLTKRYRTGVLAVADLNLQVRTGDGTPTEIADPTNPTSAVGCIEEAGIYHTSVDFHQALLATGIPHLWKDYGPTCHGPDEFREEFTDSLPGLASDFAHPRPAPRTFDYSSVEPQFTVWGWRVDADLSRAMEFLQMRGAGRGGLTLIGSGDTSVTTPPFFHGVSAVDVVGPDGTIAVRPDHAGCLHFKLDLGPAHTNQQYAPASDLAGDGGPGYFTTVAVRFVPHG